jgi:hypothetical protein
MQALLVDPPGLEPGLCGTKIRRVANYTMGQCSTKGAAKLEIFFKTDHPQENLINLLQKAVIGVLIRSFHIWPYSFHQPQQPQKGIRRATGE